MEDRRQRRRLSRPAAAHAAASRWSHAAAAAWALVVAVLLLMPAYLLPVAPSDLPSLLEGSADKLGHVALFFVLAWLLARSFRELPALRRPRLAAVLVAATYGGLLELAQLLLAARTPELADSLANLAGGLLALCVAPGPRFDPPPVELTPEVRWVLRRAFGPRPAPAPGAPAAPGAEPARCLEVARLFDLSARIVARTGSDALAAELGDDVAAAFRADRARCAARGLALLEAARAVAAAAAEIGLPVAFLKFAALELAGLVAPGSRGACDVDVLAPAGRAAELQRALAARGFVAAGPAYEHQLPALVHPGGGAVEVHLLLPGVVVGGGRDAGFADLELAGMLLPAEPALMPERPVLLPAPPVLAAHLLAHGLGQHGSQPGAYPALRLIADLVDLGFAGPDGEALARSAGALASTSISPAEVAAAGALAAALAAGELPAPDQPAERLLRHALAGRLDADYGRALKLSLLAPRPGGGPRLVRLARSLWAAVALSRAQIDAVYGPPRHPLGYLARRLARPFDLLVRLVRYAASARRLARRR